MDNGRNYVESLTPSLSGEYLYKSPIAVASDMLCRQHRPHSFLISLWMWLYAVSQSPGICVFWMCSVRVSLIATSSVCVIRHYLHFSKTVVRSNITPSKFLKMHYLSFWKPWNSALFSTGMSWKNDAKIYHAWTKAEFWSLLSVTSVDRVNDSLVRLLQMPVLHVSLRRHRVDAERVPVVLWTLLNVCQCKMVPYVLNIAHSRGAQLLNYEGLHSGFSEVRWCGQGIRERKSPAKSRGRAFGGLLGGGGRVWVWRPQKLNSFCYLAGSYSSNFVHMQLCILIAWLMFMSGQFIQYHR